MSIQFCVYGRGFTAEVTIFNSDENNKMSRFCSVLFFRTNNKIWHRWFVDSWSDFIGSPPHPPWFQPGLKLRSPDPCRLGQDTHLWKIIGYISMGLFFSSLRSAPSEPGRVDKFFSKNCPVCHLFIFIPHNFKRDRSYPREKQHFFNFCDLLQSFIHIIGPEKVKALEFESSPNL